MLANYFKDKNPKVILLDALILVLAVCFLYTIGLCVEEASWMINSSYDVDSMRNAILREDYPRVVDMYQQNMASPITKERSMKEYYAVAEYYQAATFYKMYEEVGDEANCALYREQMEEAADKLGELAIVQKSIHESLGITIK